MKNKILTFTNIIILVCIIVYILNVFIISPDTGPNSQLLTNTFIESGFGEPNGMTITMWKIMGSWGGNVNEVLGFRISDTMQGEFWRPFTVVFTHGFLLHLILNMVALYIIGNKIEKRYGILKTALVFFIVAAIDSFLAELICSNLLNSELGLAVGASGGIFALIGLGLVLEKSFWKENFKKAENIYLTIYMIFTSFINLLGGNPYSLIAHMIGLSLGIVIGISLKKLGKNKEVNN